MSGKLFQGKYKHEILEHKNPDNTIFQVRYAVVGQALLKQLFK